jgi:hypothetical protein
MPLYVHLSIGVHWNPRLHYDPFLSTLFTPVKARVTLVWLCLVIHDFGRSRVAENRSRYGPFSRVAETKG